MYIWANRARGKTGCARLRLTFAGLIGALTLGPGEARSTVIVPGGCGADGVCSVHELHGPSFNDPQDSLTLQVNDKLFSAWIVQTDNLGTNTDADVVVTGLDDDPTAPGLRITGINGAFDLGSSESQDISFGFDVIVQAGSAMQMTGTRAALVGTVGGPDATLEMVVSIFDPDDFDLRISNGVCLENTSGSSDCTFPPATAFDDAFIGGVSLTAVRVFLDFSAQTGASSSATLTSFDIRFPQVPEPGALLLLMMGLLGLAVYGRRGLST